MQPIAKKRKWKNNTSVTFPLLIMQIYRFFFLVLQVDQKWNGLCSAVWFGKQEFYFKLAIWPRVWQRNLLGVLQTIVSKELYCTENS